MKAIDCRGLACPSPVLKTKECIEKEHPDIIKVTVDNEAGKQNVSRFLKSQNFQVTEEREGGVFHIIGKMNSNAFISQPNAAKAPDRDRQKIMVMIPTDRMGFGDDELGKKLVMNFIKTLKEMGNDLWRLALVNNGVKLTIPESPALEDLKELEEMGVIILVCGTCLDHFKLLDKRQVGETTNMLDIVTAMQLADKVISL